MTTASLTKLNLEELCSCTERLKNAEEKLKKCQSLAQIVWAAWYMGMEIARIIVEQELTIRAQSPTQWSSCPKCGSRLRSKGMLPRQMKTLVGVVHFSRRVGRCSNGCNCVQQAPLDEELGLVAYQQTSQEVIQMACSLTVFVPFETACTLFRNIFPIQPARCKDFYHAAQHLWQAAAALLDGRTTKARGWFEQLRHQLRHGEHEKVLADLAAVTQYRSKPTKVMNTLRNVYAYFHAHEQHINYSLFKSMNLPLGSGMGEWAL